MRTTILRKPIWSMVVAAAFWVTAVVEAQSIFLTKDEILSLPTSGGGWTAVKTAADQSPVAPQLSNQDEKENVRTLARAMVYVRTGQSSYRDKVIATLRQVPGTEAGGRTLALGRKLGAYVCAADLIGYREQTFVDFVKAVRYETLDGSTLVKKHADKPNNWSQSCGWSRVVADLYVGDATDLAAAVKVVKGTLGDRSIFAFPTSSFGELTWQPDPTKPIVVCQPNTFIQGHIMSGAMPEELRRATTTLRFPPPCENYVFSAAEGLYGTCWVLWHSGTMPDAFQFMDNACFRIMQWNHQQANCDATGDDTWQPHLINAVYGSTFPAPSPSNHGKLLGFTDWFARVYSGIVVPPPPSPIDFIATLEWHYLPDTKIWNVHKHDSESIGTGASPAAALQDWTTKYGASLLP